MLINSKQELIIYVLGLITCSVFSKIFRGIKNGAFYAKCRQDIINPFILRYVKNIHRIETPLWYATSGITFFSLMILYRNVVCFGFWKSIFFSYLSVIFISWSTSYWWQKYINIGSGKAALDPSEPTHKEFALIIPKSGKIISFWYRKIFRYKWRVYESVIGITMLTAMIIYIIKLTF